MTNNILSSHPVRGESAYLLAFKARARDHHCPGYATVDLHLDRLEALRKEYSRRVTPITRVPLYVKAIGLALAKNPEANAILFNRPFGLRVVRFEQVDVNLPVTRAVGGREITFVGTVRDAPNKTLAQIQAELSAMQSGPAEEVPSIKRYLAFDRKPLWLARLIHAWLTWSPSYLIRNVGTCGLTLVEGDGHWGQIFPLAPSSVVFGLSAPADRPVVRDGRVTVGRVLPCALMVDQSVIPGRLAMRVLADFVGLMEGGGFVQDELNRVV